MRRIAAVAITTGALVVGMGAVSTSADASAKVTKKWATTTVGKKKNKTRMFKQMRAHGTAVRTSTSVTISGYIQDYKRDGWASGVVFRAYGNGKWHLSPKVYSTKLTRNGVYVGLADFKFDYHYGYFWSTSYTQHLSVAEVAINKAKPKKQKVGPWKKIY